MKELWSFIKDVFLFSINNGVSRHAKALTYSSVLALVPLLTVFLSSFANSSWINMARDGITNIFLDNLFPEQITTAITNHFMVMVSSAQSLKAWGMIGFVVIILFLFMDMEDTFAELVHNRCEKKKWYLRATSIFSLLVVPILLLVVIALFEWMMSYSPGNIKSFLKTLFGYSEFLKLLGAFLLWAWIYFLYRYLPHKRIKSSCLAVGSFLCMVAIVLLQGLFSWYLQIFKHYELIYGALSIIPVFLLWMYLMWQIVLHCFVIAIFCEIYKENEDYIKLENARKVRILKNMNRLFPEKYRNRVQEKPNSSKLIYPNKNPSKENNIEDKN